VVKSANPPELVGAGAEPIRYRRTIDIVPNVLFARDFLLQAYTVICPLALCGAEKFHEEVILRLPRLAARLRPAWPNRHPYKPGSGDLVAGR
jgi:hypothetical protein